MSKHALLNGRQSEAFRSKPNRTHRKAMRSWLWLAICQCSAHSERSECHGEPCDMQQSLLQHAAVISNEPLAPLQGICDTVKMPPYSPYADEINKEHFYVMAVTNDSAWNPVSFDFVDFYNFRTLRYSKHLRDPREQRNPTASFASNTNRSVRRDCLVVVRLASEDHHARAPWKLCRLLHGRPEPWH